MLERGLSPQRWRENVADLGFNLIIGAGEGMGKKRKFFSGRGTLFLLRPNISCSQLRWSQPSGCGFFSTFAELLTGGFESSF